MFKKKLLKFKKKDLPQPPYHICITLSRGEKKIPFGCTASGSMIISYEYVDGKNGTEYIWTSSSCLLEGRQY